MFNKRIMTKSAKCLMLLTMLGGLSTSLIATNTASAAELSPEINQLVNDRQAQNSAITYTANGRENVLPVPRGSSVRLTPSAAQITVRIGSKNTILRNVTDITFKGITITGLVAFHTNSVQNVTYDNVTVEKGILMSSMKGLRSVKVFDSNFISATDYSLAVNSNPNLTSFTIDNSTMNGHLRAHSNKNLSVTTVHESTLKDYIQTSGNKRGYYNDLINTRVERNGLIRIIETGGMTANDLTQFNLNHGVEIGKSKFDASQPGLIINKTADGRVQRKEIPAGVNITSVINAGNKITFKMSNRDSLVLNDAKSLTLKNVNVTTSITFTQAGLKLEHFELINSRTHLIDIANSRTMESIKIHRSDITNSAGFLSAYNNSKLKEFILQDTNIDGSAAYLSMYNNRAVEKYIMNDVYVHGYVSTYKLVSGEIQISNSRFDDYFATDHTAYGEAGPQQVGDVPTLEQISNEPLDIGDVIDYSEYLVANDTEDGEITHLIEVIDDSDFNPFLPGNYTLIVAVTDSDGNTTELPFKITLV